MATLLGHLFPSYGMQKTEEIKGKTALESGQVEVKAGIRGRKVLRITGKQKGSKKVLEQGPLEALFGGSANAKVLDFVSTYQDWDYSESDIAKYSGVNVRTVQRGIGTLVKLGLVKKVRVVGRAKMYKLDKDSETGRNLDRLAHSIASVRIHSSIKRA